jgi:hypothetical protein
MFREVDSEPNDGASHKSSSRRHHIEAELVQII